MAKPKLTDFPKLVQRFWNRVSTTPNPDDCWEWQGCRHPFGHGQIRLPGGMCVYTHRFAFYLANGGWPEMVIHSCDNPPCCNPNHLRAGNAAENMADKVARGRQLRGETSPLSKATDDQVRDIRTRYRFRKVTMKQLGLEHGLAMTTVQAILERRNWKHV